MAGGSNRFRCPKYSRRIFLKQHLKRDSQSVHCLCIYFTKSYSASKYSAQTY